MSINSKLDTALHYLYEAEEECKLFQEESDEVRIRAIRRAAAKVKDEREQRDKPQTTAVSQ